MSISSSSYQPISLPDLKEKFKQSREYFDNRIIPIDLIQEFADLIAYLEEDPLERLYQNPEYKQFFFEEFIGGLCKRLVQIKYIEPEFEHILEKIVIKICDFFVKEIQRDNSYMADAMRYLFDISTFLHQNVFQQEESAVTICDRSVIDKMSEDEKQWRQALQPGSKIDALKVDVEHNLKMWSKAEVLSITGDILQIVFENDIRHQTQRLVYWYSPEIDIYDTKTKEDDWRLSLKEGDFIDGFDSTKVWYQSTIQDTQVRKDGDRDVLFLKVGFRIYHPEGSKEDEDKRKYFGWSERFDEWLPAYSLRIQKFRQFIKSPEEADSAHKGGYYEETIDDQIDLMLYQSMPSFAVIRRRCKSALLVKFLNRIGELGGYQAIVDRISMENNDTLGLDTVYYYLDCFAKSTCIFNKVFISEYILMLEAAVRKKILGASEQALRNIKKDRIDGIINCLIGTLMSRIKTFKQREQDKTLFYLDIGCLFLSQNFLERRIDGTKILQEVCKNATFATFTSAGEQTHNDIAKQQEMQFVQKVIQTIKDQKVLQQIFSKERGHFQLVQRSEELLKLLISQNSLSRDELEYVWKSTKVDETTKLELYKVLNEVSSRLKQIDIEFLISALGQIPLHKIVSEEVELVHELGKRSRTAESVYGKMAVEYMWKLALSGQENIDKLIVNHATLALTDIMRNWENEHKLILIQRIITQLEQNQEGYILIKMLSKIFKEFSGEVISRNNQQDLEKIMDLEPQSEEMNTYSKFRSKSDFIEHINSEYKLLEIFFKNFMHYLFKARSALRAKLENEPNLDKKTLVDKVLTEKFIHSDHINERLEFLTYITAQSSIKLNSEHLSKLWDELVLHAMFTQDSDMFYRWLKDVCDSQQQQDKAVVEMSELINFFQQKIGADQEAYKTISIEGFNCIQSFFIMVNEASRKILRLSLSDSNQPVKFTSYSNTSGQEFKSYSFNQSKQNQNSDEDVEFHVLVPPKELDSIDSIWSITLEANSVTVTEKASTFLIKLYTSPKFALESQISDFERDFIMTCITNINRQREIIQTRIVQIKPEYERVEKPIVAFSSITSSQLERVYPPEEKRIKKYIQLLKDLIKNSEKEGTNHAKSHSSLFKGEYLPCLQITNSLKTGTKFAQKHEIALHSNITIWELRKIIGERVSRIYQSEDSNGVYYQDTPCHPASVRLYRYSGCTDLKEIENGRTFAECRFKPNEQLTAFRRNVYTSPKVPLLNEAGNDLGDRAKHIFTEWFNTYSIEDPDNPGRRVMTPATCADFTRSCTDDDLCMEDDSRVIGFFVQYDLDQDGKVQLEQFLQFYFECVTEREDVVRSNLLSHSYRMDLRVQPLDGGNENMMQIRSSKEQMPRYLIASDPFIFESIFSLLDQDNEISTQAWNLLKTISTNPLLYDRIIKLDKAEDFSWSGIFDSSSIYKMLYTLQIVESLLQEDQITENNGQKCQQDVDKKDWIQRFLSLGGFQEILNLFQASLNLLSQKPVDTLTKFEKNFLEFMLKMIRIFILSAFTANDQSFYEVLNLVKKTSSVVHQETKDEQNDQTEAQDKDQIIDKDDEPKENEDQFKTPAKQFKPNIDIIKMLNDEKDDQVVISQETLFGGGTQSQTRQVETDKGQGSAQQSKTDNESDRFQILSDIMRETGLGDIILEKIDFKTLQSEVLEVACLLLGKKEIQPEDVLIMESCLSLWVASLIKSDYLIEDFYNFTRSEEKSGPYGIRNAEDLILSGIYTYKSHRVREEFSNAIACICQKVKIFKTKSPLVYILDIIKKNYPREDQYYATRECKQYFDLFIAIIDEYIKIAKEEPTGFVALIVDPYEILREAIYKMKRHETMEKKGSVLEDKSQIGYFNLIEKLFTYLVNEDTTRLAQVVEDTNILHDLFYEHLFYNPQISQSKVENKSKTKESRAACYSLFQKVIESLEPRELADFMEDNLWPLLKEIKRPQKWKYVPSDNSKTQNYVGLVNLGCICYMLSMLQQFFMVPQFRYSLMKAEDDSPEDIKEYKGLKLDDNLLRQMQKMYGSLELSEKQAFDPIEFCFAFKDFDGNPTNTAIQKDAQEFLTIFFDRLEEKLKPTSQKHLLESVFGGKVCSQLICQSCGNIRNILEKFYNLSLPVKDRKGMDDSLSKMIEGFIINDFKCEACNQKVDVFKRNLIAETPNVLIVHLERIIFNFDTFQNDKINSRFEFPNILNLKNYSFKEVMKAEGRPSESMEQEHIQHLMDMDDDEFIYKLVGVIIHRGTAEHGHYYSLINTKRGQDEVEETKQEWTQTEKDPWKEFNDETVKFFSFFDLKTEAFGGNSSSNNYGDSEMSAYLAASGTQNSYGQNAYMLVYDRQKKKPLKIVEKVIIKKENASQIEEADRNEALECADTANSRVESVEEEKEILIPYRKVVPFVPEKIKSKVLLDNSHFLLDRFIYHESFINLLKAIFKHIGNKILLGQHRYKLDYIPHFTRLKKVTLEIAHKTMFEFLAYYYYNTQMSDITNSLLSIIQFCDSHVSLSRGQESLMLGFIQTAYLADDCKHFFNIMFDCGDKTSRYYIGKLTSSIVNKAYTIYQEAENKDSQSLIQLKEAVDSLITRFITTLKTSECQKNWPKFEQYLKMIHDIGVGGPFQVDFLLTKFEIVVELIDFMLGNRSPIARQRNEKRPVMGPNGINPGFEPLVALVCHLARFSMTPAMVQESHLWNETDLLPPSTLLGYTLGDGINERYPLSERTMKFIVYSGFLEQTLREGIECHELGKLLAHYCYQDLQLSKNLSKILLNGISRNDYEKVKNYLDVVTQLALIRDQNQRKRLEWIFGFGSLISHSNTIAGNDDDDDSEVKTKVGIKVLQAATDEVYTFKSALIYDSVDDALLHLLWRYKGRMDSYTVNCLYSLLNLIACDDNVAEYFSEIPGPTYSYARYTDWIKPYLNEQLVDARKGYAGSYSAQKEEIVVKALSLYEKYEEYLIRKEGISRVFKKVEVEDPDSIPDLVSQADEMEENVRNLIKVTEDQKPKEITHLNETEAIVIKCQPQPYIIVDCIQEKPVMINDFNGVILTISELTCTYTESKPTGLLNLNMPKNLFKPRSFTRVPLRRQGIVSSEQQMQAQCINNYFQSSTFSKQQKYKDTNEPDFDKSEVQEQKIIYDDSKQWEIVNSNINVSDIDENDAGYLQDQETKDNGNFKRTNSGIQYQDIDMDDMINKNLLQDQIEQVSYNIQVIEEGEIHENQTVHAIIQYNDVTQDTYAQPQNENNAQDQQFQEPQNFQVNDEQNQEQQEKPSESIIWPGEIKTCGDLVYKISVENKRQQSVKVQLTFREQEPENPSNLVYPIGGMKAMVLSNQTKTIILLHKKVPDEVQSTQEILKLAIELFWKDKVRSQCHQQIDSSQAKFFDSEAAFVNSASQGQGQQSNEESSNLQPIFENDDVLAENGDEPRLNLSGTKVNDLDDFGDITGTKECPACTFLNDASNIICEVCESSLI